MDYITTSHVARELALSEAAVRKLADAGALPVAAKLSDGTRLFEPEAVTTYAARRRLSRKVPGGDVERLASERQAKEDSQ